MIPKTAHFIWFGTTFPWVHWLSLKSAAERGGFERVWLHHADDLSASPHFQDACKIDGFTAMKLEPEPLLLDCGPLGQELTRLYRRLVQPAARANLVRLALLWKYGGVYLDLDTVTVASLTDCMDAGGAFCGEENIVFPAAVRRSKNPAKLLLALGKTGVRDVLRRLPRGFRAFKRISKHYPTAANNAVLGAEAQHPFIGQMLATALALPRERQLVRFALGTHLLQGQIAEYSGQDLRVCPPPYFYPLPPEISEHWFRETSEPDLREVLDGETRVVHWYASVRTSEVVPKIDPDYVQRFCGRQLFSALAAQFL